MRAETPLGELLADQEGTRYHRHRCSVTESACNCKQKRWVNLRVEVFMTAIYNPASEDNHPIALFRLVFGGDKTLICFHSKDTGDTGILGIVCVCYSLTILQVQLAPCCQKVAGR